MARLFPLIITAALWAGLSAGAHAQSRRLIKVVLESTQAGTSNRETVRGSGSVVIRRGTVQPSGQIVAHDRHTSVQRSSGIFTLVADGGESVLTVATRVPRSALPFYHDHALGIGAIERRIVFTDVGTSLRVYAATLPDGHIQLRLTPRISYFSAQRPGVVDFIEAAAELIVPNGQPVSLGGSTTNLHEITRHILGYHDRASGSEIQLIVTATIQ